MATELTDWSVLVGWWWWWCGREVVGWWSQVVTPSLPCSPCSSRTLMDSRVTDSRPVSSRQSAPPGREIYTRGDVWDPPTSPSLHSPPPSHSPAIDQAGLPLQLYIWPELTDRFIDRCLRLAPGGAHRRLQFTRGRQGPHTLHHCLPLLPPLA